MAMPLVKPTTPGAESISPWCHAGHAQQHEENSRIIVT